MSKYSALIKRASNATAALALTVASLTPAMMLGSSAKAAQLATRSIDMSKSTFNAASTYTVTFTGGGTFAKTRVDFCQSPLFDVSCVKPVGLVLTSPDLTYDYRYENTPGTSGFTIAVTNNPNLGTFYARISTISAGDATVNTGAVAMATTNDLTINARVQEQLSFCVGSVDDANLTGATGNATDFANCTDGEFSAPGVVDLGVVSTSGSKSPVSNTTYGGNEDTGVFMIQTNAIGGAVVSYTSAGRLKIGSECAGDTSLTDQCFNSNVDFTAWNAENFGMTLETPQKGSSKTGDGTSNLARNGDYDGTKYNWNISSSVADPIANTSSTVADWEYAVMSFKAQTAATTPTGSYTTSANFVATATF